MTKAKELEIIDSEECEIEQSDAVELAKAIAEHLAAMLLTAPDNASELVEAIEVEVEPVVVQKVTARLIMR